jgi:hypothetical protein
MIKKLLLLIILCTIPLLPQTEQQNPNVELPDFVITGTDILSVQKARKIDPEFISTLSEETLKPVFSAEELEMRDLSNPVKEEINLFDTLNYYSGKIKAGAGFYTTPVVELRYGIPFEAGIFEAFAGGKNTRSYVTNSGRYNALAGINLNLFTSQNAAFIPGSQFRFHGDYGTSSFKFYGGENPSEKREINSGNFSFDFNNLSNKWVTGGLKINDDYNQIRTESFSEHFFTTSGFLKVNLSSFNLGLSAKYNQQILSYSENEDNNYLIQLRPVAGFSVSRTMRASVGITYSKSGNEDFIAPYAAMSLRLNKNLSLYGEFAPSAELYGAGYFLSKNRFFTVNNFVNFYSEESINITGTLKYEFDKYFQIDGGVKFRSSDNLPYFEDPGQTGRFEINSADAQIITPFANFLFHRGPYGRFYGTVEANITSDENNKELPYYPLTFATLTYGLGFGNSVDLRTTLYYASDVYTDIQNTEQLGSYVDLGANIDINLTRNLVLFFEVNNLLSRANYFWRGYKEPPLDFLGGIVFRW